MNNEINAEFSNLYQDVSNNFDCCYNRILAIGEMIDKSKDINEDDKKSLHTDLEAIVNEMNFITDKLGSIGKVS